MSDLMKKAEEYATGPIELRSFLAGAREALGMAEEMACSAFYDPPTRSSAREYTNDLNRLARSLLPPTK